MRENKTRMNHFQTGKFILNWIASSLKIFEGKFIVTYSQRSQFSNLFYHLKVKIANLNT